MTFDVDEFIDNYEPPTRDVPIFSQDGLRERHASLERELADEVGGGLAGPSQHLLDQLAEVEAEIERTVKVFRLRALSYKAWTDLIAEHPPTKPQKSDGHIANPATFEPAALAASSFEPAITIDQASRLQSALPPGEWQALVNAVRDLHMEQHGAPKSLLLSVSRRTNTRLRSSSASEESLAAPSLAGADGQ